MKYYDFGRVRSLQSRGRARVASVAFNTERHDFGRATMPSLRSNHGRTRVAFGPFNVANDPIGIEVWEFPAGDPRQARQILKIEGLFRGDPDLSPNGECVVFFDAAGVGTVMHIDSQRVVLTVGRIEGNWAMKLRNDSVVYQPWGRSGVFEVSFAGGDPRRIGDYKPTGIAYLTPDGYVSWDQNFLEHDPIMIPAIAGPLTIGVGHWTGGLIAKRPGLPMRQFEGGTAWMNPAACLEPGGYAVAAWLEYQMLRVWSLTDADIDTWPLYSADAEDEPDDQHEPDEEPDPMAYERRSPDYTALVEDIARRYPAEWEAARKAPGKERTHAFVRRFTFEAAKVDKSIGLNGKRGNEHDLSADAVAYLNPTAPGGAEVIDIVIGDGHKPAWQDATLPHVLGKYVAPSDPGGGDGGHENDAKVHAYEGGENDTPPGECDFILASGAKCNRPKADPVHVVTRPDPDRPVTDPRLTPAVTIARALAVRASELAASLAALPPPTVPVCPLPPPCERPHGGVALPEYGDVLDLARQADDAYGRRILPSETTAHLLMRYLARTHTREQILEEARLRGAGEWRDQW